MFPSVAERTMFMKKTLLIKLMPTESQKALIDGTMQTYIKTVNELSSFMFIKDSILKLSSADVHAKLPAALKNQCIRDAKSVFKKHKKGITKSLAVLKKPVAMWNNQNFRIGEDSISFPIWKGRSKRISVKALITDEQHRMIKNHSMGTLRITYKNKKLMAQVTIEVPETKATGDNVMGVDLGIKVPAVCVTSDSKVRFIGNGRKNKWIRRYYSQKRKKLGKRKKLKAIRKINDKEQRIMKDIDHKLSREIVDFAVRNSVGIIRMERLQNIRETTRTSRKNNKSLHNWSFYRLSSFISYKAKLVGIRVEYVDPAYTSQVCPVCGKRNKARDRVYRCSNCGHESHRDIVGARNIMAPVPRGNSGAA